MCVARAIYSRQNKHKTGCLVMDKKYKTRGENNTAPITELKWMAEFLASHGQQKKALEIYRALVESMTRKDGDSRRRSDSKDQAA